MSTLGYTLLDHQREHVQRLVDKLACHKSMIDLSLMGRGKTYTTSYVATVLKSIVVVVCPASVETKWKEMKTVHNAPIWKVISYESLRGVKNKQPGHMLLQRFDKQNRKGVFTSFKVTGVLSSVTKRHKVLFVFDEVQKAKNKSSTAKACIALATHACQSKNSRILLLSGTPIDKKTQNINLLRMLGLVTSNVLAYTDVDTGVIKLVGFEKLYRTCIELDKDITVNIEEKYQLSKRITDYPKICYDLLIDVVLKHFSSKMPDDTKTFTLNIRNRYFDCFEEEQISIEKYIGDMVPMFNEEQTRLNNTNINTFGAIQMALMGIEISKIDIIARNAHKVLKDEPTTKVCIMVNFTQPLKKLELLLGYFKPIVINGSIPKHKRTELLAGFQSRDLDSRLVIANMDVLSTGVDLDDKFGDRKRYVFASPNYKTMVIQQMTYRFLRTDTQSNTTIDFVYANCNKEESSILGCLSRKSCTMRDACLDKNNEKVTYPDQYPKVMC